MNSSAFGGASLRDKSRTTHSNTVMYPCHMKKSAKFEGLVSHDNHDNLPKWTTPTFEVVWTRVGPPLGTFPNTDGKHPWHVLPERCGHDVVIREDDYWCQGKSFICSLCRGGVVSKGPQHQELTCNALEMEVEPQPRRISDPWVYRPNTPITLPMEGTNIFPTDVWTKGAQIRWKDTRKGKKYKTGAHTGGIGPVNLPKFVPEIASDWSPSFVLEISKETKRWLEDMRTGHKEKTKRKWTFSAARDAAFSRMTETSLDKDFTRYGENAEINTDGDDTVSPDPQVQGRFWEGSARSATMGLEPREPKYRVKYPKGMPKKERREWMILECIYHYQNEMDLDSSARRNGPSNTRNEELAKRIRTAYEPAEVEQDDWFFEPLQTLRRITADQVRARLEKYA